jgi:predicted cupin superfamily sugar epimerase
MTGPRDADQVIAALGLEPHPEGGWFRETWREPATTAIFFLLRAGEWSHWHRVDATEIWHFYSGDPLELALSEDGRGTVRHVLGPDLAAGQRPQLVVPAGTWQSARPLGAWTLAGCTVSPAFQFTGFELADPGWEPSL